MAKLCWSKLLVDKRCRWMDSMVHDIKKAAVTQIPTNYPLVHNTLKLETGSRNWSYSLLKARRIDNRKLEKVSLSHEFRFLRRPHFGIHFHIVLPCFAWTIKDDCRNDIGNVLLAHIAAHAIINNLKSFKCCILPRYCGWTHVLWLRCTHPQMPMAE